MTLALRLLLAPLVFLSVVGAVVTIVVWWLPMLILGVASHYGAWLIGLPVLFALLLTSAAVALSGPLPDPVPDEAEA